MYKTRVTELFGIEHPIIQGGMIWVAGWKLAVAVAEGGGLGLIGAGSMTPAILREHVRKAKAARPGGGWGVNLPIFGSVAADTLAVLLEEGVKVIFTSGGSPKLYTRMFKDAGMTVAHVTSTPTLAVKCEDAGVDAVVVEGFEAGGHNGRDELTTMVLVPQAVDAVKVPVIAAGGIYDGRGMAAALAMGAAGVQIGTRFVATAESSGHEAFKKAVVDASPTGTFLVLRKLIPVRVIKNEWAARMMKAEARGADDDELLEILGAKRNRLGMFEGDVKEGELEIGQAAGAVRDIPSATDLVRRIALECEETLARLNPTHR
ncbi:MAG: nitronate monooxygenase [Deltaproteobacteria bacterium]|nr:nitronate monooxygenase [Deltaproteobacteria bacterium]